MIFFSALGPLCIAWSRYQQLKPPEAVQSSPRNDLRRQDSYAESFAILAKMQFLVAERPRTDCGGHTTTSWACCLVDRTESPEDLLFKVYHDSRLNSFWRA